MLSLVPVVLALGGGADSFEQLHHTVLKARPSDGDALVASFVARAGGTPIIEGGQAIFVVKGGSEAPPRVVGDFNGWGEGDPEASRLERLGETMFFFKHVTLEPAARVEYLIAGEGREDLDPLNPVRVDGFAEPHSEVRMPGYVAPPELQIDPLIPKGRVVSFEHESGLLGNKRSVHVYLPPAYDTEPTRRYPEAWFGDGALYVERVFVPRILDYLIARRRIEPVVAILVDPVDRRTEYAGHDGHRRMMVSELVPRVAREFRVLGRADRRLIAGGSRGGQAAIDLALAHPDTFGLCGAWAPAVAPRRVSELLSGRPAGASRFLLIRARYDQAWGPDAPALRDGLAALGARPRYAEIPEGHTLATWRGVIDDVLVEFFPADPTKGVSTLPGSAMPGLRPDASADPGRRRDPSVGEGTRRPTPVHRASTRGR